MYQILDTTYLENKKLLGEEDFMQAFSKNKLTSYTIDVPTDAYWVNSAKYNITLNLNGKNVNESIILKNINVKWMVDPEIFLRKIEVHCPEYMTLKINNKKIDFDENEKAFITTFIGTSLQVSYPSNYTNDIGGVIIATKYVETINPNKLDIDLSAETKKEIEKIISGFVEFNNTFSYKTKYSEIEKYLKSNSEIFKLYEKNLRPNNNKT